MKLTRAQAVRAAKLQLGKKGFGVGNRKLKTSKPKPERNRNLPARDDRYHTLPVKDPVMRYQPMPRTPKVIDDTMRANRKR